MTRNLAQIAKRNQPPPRFAAQQGGTWVVTSGFLFSISFTVGCIQRCQHIRHSLVLGSSTSMPWRAGSRHTESGRSRAPARRSSEIRAAPARRSAAAPLRRRAGVLRQETSRGARGGRGAGRSARAGDGCTCNRPRPYPTSGAGRPGARASSAGNRSVSTKCVFTRKTTPTGERAASMPAAHVAPPVLPNVIMCSTTINVNSILVLPILLVDELTIC